MTGRNRLQTFCDAVLLWLASLFLITEILSCFHLLNRTAVIIFWIAFVLAVAAVFIVRKPRIRIPIPKERDPLSLFLFGILAVLLLRSTWLALNTVPYNWDSMTYHLPRIMFWIEHGSADYYETNIIRQVISPVLAEYVNLHVFLLTGGDRFANLLQNLSLYGCVFLAMGIIGEFRCDKKWKAVGGILLVTMNAVYAEATTTQVDLFSAFLLLVLVRQVLQLCKAEQLSFSKQRIGEFAMIGLSAGLLYITKGNAAIPAAFIAVVFVLIRLVRKDQLKTLLLLGLIACLIAGAVALPTFLRNARFTGDILASDYIGGITVGSYKPGDLIVNAAKNFSNAAVSPYNKAFLESVVRFLGKILRVDVDAEAIRFGNYSYQVQYSTGIDTAGAPLLAVLLLIGLLIGIPRLLILRNRREVLAFSLLFQFYLSCLVIRWQPWVVRLLIPSLCLAVPAVIYYIASLFRECSGKGGMKTAACLVSSAIVFLCLAGNFDEYAYLRGIAMENVRQEQSREELYFTARDKMFYTELCGLADGDSYNRIGLYTDEDSYQYPFLARYSNQKAIENVVLETDNTGLGMNAFFHPDLILVTNVGLDSNREYYCNGNSYYCVQDFGAGYSAWGKVHTESDGL